MFRRKPKPIRDTTRAARRAQMTSTADLQFWVGITMSRIADAMRVNSPQTLDDAEQYAASLHAIIKELRIRSSHLSN